MIKKFKDIYDKYELLEEIQDGLLYLTDNLEECISGDDLEEGQYSLHLNDTKTNSYADDNYYFSACLQGNSLPKGYFNDIEDLSNAPFYSALKNSINRLKHTKHVNHVLLYYENDKSEDDEDYDHRRGFHNATLLLKIIVNDKHGSVKYGIQYEDGLKKMGFQVGLHDIAMVLKNFIVKTSKSEESRNTSIYFLDKDWNFMEAFSIDERGFNIMDDTSSSKNKILKNISEEHKKMKLSNPDYGTYGIKGTEYRNHGSKNLRARDFIIWLKNKGY